MYKNWQKLIFPNGEEIYVHIFNRLDLNNSLKNN